MQPAILLGLAHLARSCAARFNTEDDGTVHIYASKAEGLERAKSMIEHMSEEIEVGKVYTGKIVSITTFGAFMEVLPGKDGLIHVSELAEGRTEKVEDVVKKGDLDTAKCLGVDEMGRVKKSRRAWLRDQKAEEAEAATPAEQVELPEIIQGRRFREGAPVFCMCRAPDSCERAPGQAD